MSNMYSLLNHVAATSKEIHDAPHNTPPDGLFSNLNNEHAIIQSDRATLHSIETHDHTEEERRLITTSTISVVSRLALEFKLDEVSAVIYIEMIPT